MSISIWLEHQPWMHKEVLHFKLRCRLQVKTKWSTRELRTTSALKELPLLACQLSPRSQLEYLMLCKTQHRAMEERQTLSSKAARKKCKWPIVKPLHQSGIHRPTLSQLLWLWITKEAIIQWQRTISSLSACKPRHKRQEWHTPHLEKAAMTINQTSKVTYMWLVYATCKSYLCPKPPWQVDSWRVATWYQRRANR